MESGNNKSSIILLAILIVLVVLASFYLGVQTGKRRANNIEGLVDLAFPPPPSEIHSLSGVIKNVIGASINMEIDDLNDYLPHLDNSPRKKETRLATVTPDTTYSLLNYSQIDSEGNPERTDIDPTTFKEGDVITVRSDENIRKAKKFDVTAIEMVRY